ncbi:MAG: hypothetical protein ABR518_06810 [Actinomycetota bacterium]
MFRRIALIELAALALTTSPALAGQPEPSIRVNESAPRLGGTVTFTTTYARNTPNPRVTVRCYQTGVLVYAESEGPSHGFVLGGAVSDWARNGGTAECTGELWSLVWRGNRQQQVTTLAMTSFSATG